MGSLDFSGMGGAGPLPARYTVVRVLGQGGFGVVVLARDRDLGREVAIKQLLPTATAEDREILDRFDREALAMARLEHPHLVRVLDHGVEGSRPYLVMELVNGHDLAHLLARDGAMDPPRVVRVVAQVGGALDALHAAGMVHRDLKPPNVMLRAGSEDAVLMDLGMVHLPDLTVLTRTGQVMGTPRYLPPEILRGEGAGPASDQFQLAVIARELLTGRPLVEGRDIVEISRRVLSGDFGNLPEQLPPDVTRVLDRALTPFPGERYGSCGALAEALDAAVSGRPVEDPEPARSSATPGAPVGLSTGVHRPHGRRWGRALALLALGLLGVGLGLRLAGPSAPRDVRWEVVGDALVVRLAGGDPDRLELVVDGAPVDAELVEEGSGVRTLVHRGLGAEEARARLRWPGGEGPVAGYRAERPTVAERPTLAPAAGVRVEVRRPARVGWEGGALREVEPGAVDLPPPPGFPATLAWEEAGVRFTREVTLPALHGNFLGDLERALAPTDLEGALLRRIRDRGLAALAPGPEVWAQARTRVAGVLQGPLPREPRIRLLRLLTRWRVAFAVARIAGHDAPSLDLERGAPGSRFVGLPEWSRGEGIRPELTPDARYAIRSGKPGYQLASREGLVMLNVRYRHAAQEVFFSWPELAAPPGKLVALSLYSRTFSPKGAFAVTPEGWARDESPYWFWAPAPHLGDSVGIDEWLTLVIPRDLAPSAGTRMALSVMPLGRADALLSWIEGVRVEAEP